MSHEKSVTIRHGKKWVNLKSVHGGKTLDEDTVADWYRKGHLKPLGGKTYDSLSGAVGAARSRSRDPGWRAQKEQERKNRLRAHKPNGN